MTASFFEKLILVLLISHMVFNPFKMAVQFFQTAPNFPNFDGSKAFSPNIQQVPGPDFRNVGKSLHCKILPF